MVLPGRSILDMVSLIWSSANGNKKSGNRGSSGLDAERVMSMDRAMKTDSAPQKLFGSIAGLSGRMPPKKGEKETLPDGVPANWSAWRLSRDEQDRRESSSIDVSHMHSQITCMQTRKNKKKEQKTKNKKNLLRTGLGEF
jgi:hypothetical protein